MTVKEIFDLRKQGRIEEAYEAILPMYAVHQAELTDDADLQAFYKKLAEKQLRYHYDTKRNEKCETGGADHQVERWIK